MRPSYSTTPRSRCGRLLGLLLTASLLSLAAPAVSHAAIEHAPFDTLLQRHVAGGRVNYAALKKDEAALDAYLATLAEVKLAGAGRAAKLALYINAYNAFTLKLILRHLGRIKSIREIDKPWKTREWRVAGETLSLDEIEHTKLRGELKEPRIHFAVVCASIGCPPLWQRAYSASNIERELDAAARRFIAKGGGAKVWEEGGKRGLALSKIFEWFGDDFRSAGAKGSEVHFIARYGTADVVALVKEGGATLPLRYQDYDWRLNAR